MNKPSVTSDSVFDEIRSGDFDFLDLGCSTGASIEYAQERLGGERGLGLDLAPQKVEAAQAAGFEARVCDATQLEACPDAVRFVTARHFLEHVPGREEAARCLRAACVAAREFVYVQQPYFDADEYLEGLGLRLYWSHWKGHPYHMTSADFCTILDPLMREGIVRRYAVYADHRIEGSSSSMVHSVDSPIDQHHWKVDEHPPKPEVEFGRDVFREMRCLIATGPDTHFSELERSFPHDVTVYARP